VTEAQHTTNLIELAAAAFGDRAQELRRLGQAIAEARADIHARLATPPPSILQLPSKPVRRKPSLDRIRKQAAKAGIAVASYTVNPDGSITVVPGQPDTSTNTPWDEVLPHAG
jgi:hypothetical protein